MYNFEKECFSIEWSEHYNNYILINHWHDSGIYGDENIFCIGSYKECEKHLNKIGE